MKLRELAILNKLYRKSKIDEPAEFDANNTGSAMFGTHYGLRGGLQGVDIEHNYLWLIDHPTMVARACLIVHAINALPDLLSLAMIALTEHPQLAECDDKGVRWDELLARQNESPISIQEELDRR